MARMQIAKFNENAGATRTQLAMGKPHVRGWHPGWPPFYVALVANRVGASIERKKETQ